jgi:ribosomal protein L37E
MSTDSPRPRGLPLLSGPPSLAHISEETDKSCRKCDKDLTSIFVSGRRCEHCGYVYCRQDSDYTALRPRPGNQAGYDSVAVCAFCIGNLTSESTLFLHREEGSC